MSCKQATALTWQRCEGHADAADLAGGRAGQRGARAHGVEVAGTPGGLLLAGRQCRHRRRQRQQRHQRRHLTNT